MEPKDLKLNALVWAKMKNFSPWPAKIAFPYDGKMPRSKKPHHFVYFFGTRNYAWISDEFIIPHSRKMLQNTKTYKKISNTMKMAIDELKIECRKISKKRKKPLEVQVKTEPSEKTSVHPDTTTKKSKRLNLKNNSAIVKKRPKKQPYSEIANNSKSESLQVEKKQKCSEVTVKLEPLDPSDEKTVQPTTTEKSKKKNSINKTVIVKKKAKKQPILDTTSDDFKNFASQNEKKCKRHLRDQVKKSPIEYSNKKLKNAPKTPKKTTFTNNIQLREQSPKKLSKVKIQSIQACSKKSVQVKNTQKNTRKETLRNLAKNPISKNKTEIEKKTTKKQHAVGLLLDIKKEPVFETKGNAVRKSISKSKTDIEDFQKQCTPCIHDPKEPLTEMTKTVTKKSSKNNSETRKKRTLKQHTLHMVSDLKEPITGIKKTETKKSTSKNKTEILKKNVKYRSIQTRVSDLENGPEMKRKKTRVKEKCRIERKIPENLHPELNPACASTSSDFQSSSLGKFQENAKTSLVVIDLHSHSECKNVSVVSPNNDSSIYRASTSRENPVFDSDPIVKMVGFLGVGRMGNQIIKNLIQSGYTVIAWNRSMSDNFIEVLHLGAKRAQNPSEVICLCDITFCCVLDVDAVKAVVFSNDGVLDGFFKTDQNQLNKHTKSYVEMTSIDPTTSQEIAEVIMGVGGRYLEAPMVGSIQQMNEKAMVVVAGGDYDLFNECQEYFAAWASHALFVGCDVGGSSKMNLLSSMVLGTTYAALGEAVELAKSYNISKEDFLDTIRSGPLACPLIINKVIAMFDNSTKVEYPLKHQQKELNLAISMNEDSSQPLLIASAANESYKRAMHQYSEYDVAAVHRNNHV